METRPSYIPFIVRLWSEPLADTGWIAQVELIPSGEQRYFASLDDLFTFIRRQLAIQPADKNISQ